VVGVGVADVVETLDGACVEVAEQQLRETGGCGPPTAYVLSRHLAHPYIGSISTRPFYRGRDGAAAVTALGLLPSVLCATRLIVVWEYADLCRALELPGGDFPTALVVLDASLDDQVLRWHPFTAHPGPLGLEGLPTVRPEWLPSEQFLDAPLPAPVVELLALWRAWRSGDVDQTARELERAGFRVRWAQR
jgi:hypothetical protein